MADLRRLVQYDMDGIEDEDLGSFSKYGFCFDYVAPGIFGESHKEGYFRYQLSCGGPQDKFRIFVNMDGSPHRIEYWYLDWFNGAHITMDGNDLQFFEDDILSRFDLKHHRLINCS